MQREKHLWLLTGVTHGMFNEPQGKCMRWGEAGMIFKAAMDTLWNLNLLLGEAVPTSPPAKGFATAHQGSAVEEVFAAAGRDG